MSAPLRVAAASWIHKASLLVLLLLTLPLTACSAPRPTYDLSRLAIESVDEASRPAVKLQVANLTPGDHTEANLQLAADLLAKANIDAPTSPQSRAAQALIVDALPENAWIQYDPSPELRHQLGIAFDQAHQRMKEGTPDLMTTIVWARTGIALGRTEQLYAVMQRAVEDPRLKNALREDDATRDQLWTHLGSQSIHDPSVESVVYRCREVTSEDVANQAFIIVAWPVLIIMLALGGFPKC